ncbi:DUF4870 domain-containing protein [Pseudotenacibaculum haliotis]|uniref:DUF4870 domain-containing protein n=1 Tax=Pseudotenacibaculum haliotis TaxID=1862138 RepID=A0ABW5LQ76_9FLAO
MKQNNENTNAFLIHISAFAGFLFPFGSIITPLIVWQTLKDRSQFLDEQGKEAVNFNISYSLYMFIASIIAVPFFLRSIFNNVRHGYGNNWHYEWDFDLGFGSLFGLIGFGSLVGIIGLIKLVLIILAAVKANKGEDYRYPFTIKFIK